MSITAPVPPPSSPPAGPPPPPPSNLPAGPPPPPPGLVPGAGGMGHVLRNAALFGGIGAAAGFGLSFLSLPVIGQLSAPIAAIIGGALGVVTGAVKGMLDNRRSGGGPSLAAPRTAVVGAGAIPVPRPGATFPRT